MLQVPQSLYDLGSTQDLLGGLLVAVFILYHVLMTCVPFLSKLVLARQWEAIPRRSLRSLNSLGPGKYGSRG